jgi:hypothetical protein
METWAVVSEYQFFQRVVSSRSTSSGRIGRTGGFRILGEYPFLWNELVPFRAETEHENPSHARNRSIPFQQILKPNTP